MEYINKNKHFSPKNKFISILSKEYLFSVFASRIFFYYGDMKICLIHKGSPASSGVQKYLQESSFSLEEILLQDQESFPFVAVAQADIIIFDVISGKGEVGDYSFIKRIKTATPILLATNNNEASLYREKMLDAGVDGCIQTPFLKEELILRLTKLVNKKGERLFSGTNIESSGVVMNLRDHVVMVEGEIVSFTKTEYSILLHLFLHKDRIVSNKELSLYLGEEIKKDSLALNIHIFNLRKKIKDPHLIKTVPRYGFTISSPLNV